MVGMDQKDSWVDDKAQSKHGVLTLKYSIEHGFVTNWDDMKRIAQHVLQRAARATRGAPGLASWGNPRPTVSAWHLIMVKTFNVPAMYVAIKLCCLCMHPARYWHCHGLWRWRVPHGANPRWISPVPRHLAFGLGRPWSRSVLDEDPGQGGLLVHVDRSARDRA